jgi:hypothetical protein
MNKTVVIVARTKMYGGRVCVGALSEDGENIRLMNANCTSDLDGNSPYQIGEVWQVTGDPCGEQRPPHLEDFAVSVRRSLRVEKNLIQYISERAKAWQGGIEVLFDGTIQFTQNGAAYISDHAIPGGATGFWTPMTDLVLRSDDRGKSAYYPEGDYRHLSYVGLRDPVKRIAAGNLVRVSLARWWKPRDADPEFEERCYAQLSCGY